MRNKRQEISSALLHLALFVTFEILPSTRAAPINSQKNTAVHSKEAEEDVVPKKVTYNRTSEISKNCAELYKSGQTMSGVYTIDPDGSGAFNVSCDQTTSGGGWTVFQKRMDGSVDFNRTWDDYKHGFDETVIFDSLGRHRNLSFGTWDRDPHNCDQKIGGGWWYGNCAVWSNLNGLYFGNKTSRAIYWSMLGTIPEESIPKSAEMKIRPVDFVSSF